MEKDVTSCFTALSYEDVDACCDTFESMLGMSYHEHDDDTSCVKSIDDVLGRNYSRKYILGFRRVQTMGIGLDVPPTAEMKTAAFSSITTLMSSSRCPPV